MTILQDLERLRLERNTLMEKLGQHKLEAKMLQEQITKIDADVYAMIAEENSPQGRLPFREDPTDQDEPMPKPRKRTRRKAGRGAAGLDPTKVQWPE